MADFIKAFNKTVGNEGGYDNDERDKGNWTGKEVGKGVLAGTINGITCWEVEDYYGRPITADDVKNLPVSIIQEIYKKKYWDVMKGDILQDQSIAEDIFDFGVNTGISTGIKQWQRSQGLPETGKMDDTTLNEINVPL